MKLSPRLIRKRKPIGNYKICGSCDGYGEVELPGSERCEFGPGYTKCYSCHGIGYRKSRSKIK